MSAATTNKAMMPDIRFPEFTDEWSPMKLSAGANVYDGTHQTPKYVDEGIKFVSVENIANLKGTKRFISKEAYERDFKIKPTKNDILMTRITAGIIGATSIITDNEPYGYYVSLALIRVKPNLLNYFLAQYIACVLFRRELHKRIIHVAFPKKINLGEIGDCLLSSPSLPEQHKIAGFLGVADARVDLLQRRRDALQDYKKGIIQRLFTQELRFMRDDGTAFPDWDEMPIGKIGKTIGGLTGKSKEDFGEGFNFVTYKQVFANSKIDISECGKVKISPDERQNLLRYGDVLFTTSSETQTEVGFASVIVEKPSELYLNSFCFALRPNSVDEVLPHFAQYLFRCPAYRSLVYPLAQGSTRYNLSKSSFVKLYLALPCPEEQQKIADFLSALDLKIDAVAAQITAMQDFKKGLLQLMFV